MKQLLILMLASAVPAAQAGGEELMLRSPKTPCGYYLTRTGEDSKGTAVSLSLDPGALDTKLDALMASGERLPADAKFVVVGASWKRSERKAQAEVLREQLKARGYGDVPVQTVRHLESWADQVRGVFQLVDGAWQKRAASAEPEVMTRAAEAGRLDPELPTLVVGVPLFGRAARNTESFIESLLESHSGPVSVQTTLGGMVTGAFKRPWEFLIYLGKRARSLAPLAEDYQTPTASEKARALEKLVIPGGLTFAVLTTTALVGDKPLEIALPIVVATTVFNSINSLATGIWRSTLNNWFTRSLSVVPDQFLKDISLSMLFTSTIYFGGTPARWSDWMTTAGWSTLAATKWLSILFNASWRAPNNAVIADWQHYAMETLGRDGQSVRHAGATISKYTSYLMTQFYIFSILTESALFRVVQGSGGLQFLAGNAELPAGASSLMDFNVGHAAMAACGVVSMCISSFRPMQTRIADWAVRVDAVESRFIRWILRRD